MNAVPLAPHLRGCFGIKNARTAFWIASKFLPSETGALKIACLFGLKTNKHNLFYDIVFASISNAVRGPEADVIFKRGFSSILDAIPNAAFAALNGLAIAVNFHQCAHLNQLHNLRPDPIRFAISFEQVFTNMSHGNRAEHALISNPLDDSILVLVRTTKDVLRAFLAVVPKLGGSFNVLWLDNSRQIV